MLKLDGGRLKESRRFNKKDIFYIKSAKAKSIGNMEVLPISYNGSSGFLPLNKIVPPSMFLRLKHLLSKPPRQPDERANYLNDEIQKILIEVNKKREEANGNRYPPLDSINIVIDGKRYEGINYVRSVKPDKFSVCELILGHRSNNNQITSKVWIGKYLSPDDSNNLCSFFDDNRSWIYKNYFLISLFNKAHDNYTERNKLTITCVTKADNAFFTKALLGEHGRR